jgi:hypothetical protein
MYRINPHSPNRADMRRRVVGGTSMSRSNKCMVGVAAVGAGERKIDEEFGDALAT